MNSALTLDIPFARKVLEHLIAHPEEHRQANFGMRTACGTTACIAGTAVLMDPDTQVQWTSDGAMTYAVQVGEDLVDITDRAAALLGLDFDDANRLFYIFGNMESLKFLSQLIEQAEVEQNR